MVKRAGGALLPGIGIDPGAARPVGLQLHAALREAMLTGALAPGDRLPASRTLARELGLSRTTVVEVFERLAAEGLLEARVGAGSFVAAALAAERPAPPPRPDQPAPAAPPRLSAGAARALSALEPRPRLPQSPRAFVTGLPAFDAFPMARWAKLAAAQWRGPRGAVLGYGEAGGHGPLRRAIAAHLRLNRATACEPEQVFVVGGAQQAFQLLGRLLLDPGDAVWFENPGAIGARNGLVAAGARLVPVPVDIEGLVVEQGLRLAPDFRLAFVTPAHQQPLGAVMSLERRFALLQAAERAGAWILEDDYDGEFCFGRRPPPTLKSIDRTGRVIYVGTFSKSLFPALRLGFLVVPPALVETLEVLAAAVGSGLPTSLQATVAAFIEEGHFAAHVRRLRRLHAERQEVLLTAARAELAGLLEVVPAESGLHTPARLAPGLGEAAAVAAAAAQGVTVAPLARYALAPLAERGLVLGFAAVPPAEVRRGVSALARALTGLRPVAA